jgi:hypothetical protein
MGECLLEKTFKVFSNKKNTGNFKLVKSKILMLGQGDFSGLEAINKNPSNYEFTLTVKENIILGRE